MSGPESVQTQYRSKTGQSPVDTSRKPPGRLSKQLFAIFTTRSGSSTRGQNTATVARLSAIRCGRKISRSTNAKIADNMKTVHRSNTTDTRWDASRPWNGQCDGTVEGARKGSELGRDTHLDRLSILELHLLSKLYERTSDIIATTPTAAFQSEHRSLEAQRLLPRFSIG